MQSTLRKARAVSINFPGRIRKIEEMGPSASETPFSLPRRAKFGKGPHKDGVRQGTAAVMKYDFQEDDA